MLMSPGGNGGANWAPMSYSPQTGYFYVTAADRPQSRIAAPAAARSRRTRARARSMAAR